MMRERVFVTVVPLIAGLMLTARAGRAQEAEGPPEPLPAAAPRPVPTRAANDPWINACVQASCPACTSAPGGHGLRSEFELLHARGRRELIEGRLEEAIADFTDALRLNPYDACTYYLRALALRRSIPVREYRAVGDLSEALRLNPGLVTAYVQRAQAYTRLAEWTKTDKALEAEAQVLEYAMAQVNAMTQNDVIERVHSQAEALSRRLREEKRLRIDASTLAVLADRGGPKFLGVLQLGGAEERVGPAEALAYYRRALADYTKALRLDPYAPESKGMIQVVQDRMALLGAELDTLVAVKPGEVYRPAGMAPPPIAP